MDDLDVDFTLLGPIRGLAFRAGVGRSKILVVEAAVTKPASDGAADFVLDGGNEDVGECGGFMKTRAKQ